jgi:hypothetical protein
MVQSRTHCRNANAYYDKHPCVKFCSELMGLAFLGISFPFLLAIALRTMSLSESPLLQAPLLTAVLLVLYGLAIWRMLAKPEAWLRSEKASFPEFSSTLAALIAVSLAGYGAINWLINSIVQSAASKLRTGPANYGANGMPGTRLIDQGDNSGSRIVSY